MLEPEDLHEDHKLSESQAALLLALSAGLAVLVALVTANV